MNEITTTEKTIATLDPQAAFKLIEFYENAANIVKGGAWTITTWILTINAALLAYSFQLYTEHSDLHGFIWIQGAICCVGFALCVFLCFLILDQGNHLRGYWTAANKIGAWNAGVQDLVLKEGDVQTVREPDYRANFPRFCKRLVALTSMFMAGFLGTFVIMWVLTMDRNG